MQKGSWVPVAVTAAVIAFVVAFTMGLLDFPTNAPEPAPVASSSPSADQAAQVAALQALKPADGWQELESGVRWRRVKGDGKGAHPKVTDTVKLNYVGKLIDGKEFDKSEPGKPATFPLGGLIKGWQIAIPQAGVGDTIEIAIPSEVGYGPDGSGPIPGGATLMFTVELLGIEPAAS